MQYFLHLRIIGLCAREALLTQGLEEAKPCIIHENGMVYDANLPAIARRITLSSPLKEAKVILQSDACYVEYKPEIFSAAKATLLELCLLYSHTIQAGRAGELILDLTPHPHPIDIATHLLGEVHKKYHLPLRAGIAPAVWLAENSSTLCDTQALDLGILPIEPVLDPTAWLAPQSVAALSPIDPKDRLRLHHLGFDKVFQVQNASQPLIEQQFPKRGAFIKQTALGRLADPIKPNYPANQITEEINLSSTENLLDIQRAAQKIAQRLAEKLSNSDEQAKTILLTVVFESGLRNSVKKSVTKPISTATSLSIAAGQLLQTLTITEPIDSLRISLLELSASKNRQVPLPLSGQDSEAKKHVASALERIQSSHGTDAIRVASALTLTFNQQVLKEWKRVTDWH